MIKCKRCNGAGKITRFSHIENGKCFNCNGTGNIPGGVADEEKTMQSFFEFPFSLQPNPGRADFQPASQRPGGTVAFDTVMLEVDEKLALCRNVIVSVRVGQELVLECPITHFEDGKIKLARPWTVLPHQDVFVRLSWEVGDDWHRLNENYGPLQGKVVLPYWTVEAHAGTDGPYAVAEKLHKEIRALRKENEVLCKQLDRPGALLLLDEISALRAERPRTGLADVPEYHPGVAVRCQNDEDGGY